MTTRHTPIVLSHCFHCIILVLSARSAATTGRRRGRSHQQTFCEQFSKPAARVHSCLAIAGTCLNKILLLYAPCSIAAGVYLAAGSTGHTATASLMPCWWLHCCCRLTETVGTRQTAASLGKPLTGAGHAGRRSLAREAARRRERCSRAAPRCLRCGSSCLHRGASATVKHWHALWRCPQAVASYDEDSCEVCFRVFSGLDLSRSCP